MTERPQSRMVPALTAALVGALLGALLVLLGVLAGQKCCCNGSVCGEAARDSRAPADYTPSHLLPFIPGPPPFAPRQDFFILPDTPRHDVPLPGSLMLVGAGLLAWRLT